MAESTKPAKTSRTPEEKAAREARKASKKSAAAVDNEAGPSGSTAAPVDKQPKGVNAEDYEIDLAAPEPLSKAELRAAKRAAKRGDVPPAEGEKPKKRKRLPEFDPNEADEEEKPKGGAAEGAGREVKKQNSVWVGNLAFKTTPQSLREWFERKLEEAGAGGEGSVTRVNLPKKAGKGGFGESKGFAYVDLATPEVQKLAVGLSEGMLEGRKLLIKLGNDHTASESARTPKPAKSLLTNPILRNQPNPEGPTLFVGNLPFDATEEKLRDHLEGNAAALRAAAEKEGEVDEKKAAKREKWLKKQAAKAEAEAAGGVKNEEEDDEAESDDEAEGDTEDAAEELDEETKAEQAYRGGRKSGLRKVRLGAFEDTGRCKGFAFLDFLDPKFATAALSNKKNHWFENRKLILQYASDSATKRAGGKGSRPVRAAGGDDYKGGLKRPRQSYDRKDRDAGGDADVDADVGAYLPKDASAIARDVLRNVGGGGHDEGEGEGYGGYQGGGGGGKKREDVRGKKWQAAGRPRPGAALAMAKREKVGIVPGEGKKISFD